MTQANLIEIHDALKTRLELVKIPGTAVPMEGRVFDFIPGTMEPPSITIVPGTFVPGDTKAAITYDATMARGSSDHVFTFAVAVSRVAERDSFLQLNAFLAENGDSSIKEAVEGDGGNLGGVVSFAHVQRVIQYGPLRFNDLSFFGAQVICNVTT